MFPKNRHVNMPSDYNKVTGYEQSTVTGNEIKIKTEKTTTKQANKRKVTNLVVFGITKTCLYNFDPIKPHFYIVKLGFTGVYIIFHISAQNIDCGYSLEPPRRGGSDEYPQSMFCAEIWKISEFFIWKFSVFRRWNFPYIWIGVFS